MAYPLFKACTRAPMLLGVPLRAGLVVFMAVVLIALMSSIFVIIAIVPIWLIMREIAKKDDKQFNLIYCWFTTKALYPKSLKNLWGNATSYNPNTDHLSRLKK
ncbi:VirB3 family type IV secretion system protein [Acinetobacter pittii]|uniref:type IV secretion system protein VirB3 n=1 Tax=Acinetobacter pittii TaxID=48296 RepID=UPI003260D46D